MFKLEVVLGLTAYAKANTVVSKYRLWPYLIIPGVFSLAYFPFIIFLGYLFFDDFATFLHSHLIPNILQWKVILYFLNLILWLIGLVFAYMTYKFVILILFSPVMGYLSEVTEKVMLGSSPPPWNFRNFMNDLTRALIINTRSVVLTLVLMFFAWLLVFIPIIGVIISPVLIFLIQFYYTGCGLIDSTLERKRYSVNKTLQFARTHRGVMLGLGGGFTLLLMIPLVGWYLAPSYGTIAGTLATLEILTNETHPVQEN